MLRTSPSVGSGRRSSLCPGGGFMAVHPAYGTAEVYGRSVLLSVRVRCCLALFPFSLVSSHSFHCCSTRCLPLRLPVFLSRKILGVRDPCSSLSAPCSAVRISSDMACRHVAPGQTWDVFCAGKCDVYQWLHKKSMIVCNHWPGAALRGYAPYGSGFFRENGEELLCHSFRLTMR